MVRQETDLPDGLEGKEQGHRLTDVVLVVVDAVNEWDADPDLAPGRNEGLEVLEYRGVRYAGEFPVPGLVHALDIIKDEIRLGRQPVENTVRRPSGRVQGLSLIHISEPT